MIIIGEKINGSIPKTGKAIKEHDEAYIKELAKMQTAAQANYIDCCASVNEGELETEHWLIDLIQGESDTPISVDSPNPQVIVDAMEFCKKPGLINSVSMEGNKIDTIFPVIKDTEWNCVALLCDDKGIPSTVEARIAIFKQIMERCEKDGIAPERMFIDPLVETLGTNGNSLLNFAECCRQIKALYPTVHITSGLSNISFGLPVRKIINLGFMSYAIEAGMDSAIIDPTNRDLIGIIYACGALQGNDDFCMEYLNAYRENLFGPVQE